MAWAVVCWRLATLLFTWLSRPILARSGPDIDRESVEALMVKGADPNAPDDNGATPLHHAVIADGSDALESVRLLLWAGADPGAQLDSPSELKYGLVSRTPLAIARELGNTSALALLEDAGHKA
ncbi:ankyrin repeat domain-containing protein [Nonomuraea sp. NPDC049709]|uniref:ankyrin repeat domain-containing protein n=1 Tax=Nonomuraea sp. NPDC049709 TaxID=3154736 RepID=UPI00344A6EA8